MDILQEIIATKRQELAALHATGPVCGDVIATPKSLATPKPSLRTALLTSETGIIAEFKRRSPSKGWIKEEGRPDVIPLSYQQNGAAALSILTDEHYFGGHDDFIRAARTSGVTLPVLYKNFVIDESQLYAAALCGASAVLLIAACLTKQECKVLMDKAHELGLEVLLEMHSEEELEYASLCPDLCGINNRNLGSFVTDVENSFRLADRLRAVCYDAIATNQTVLVSESGISNPDTVKALRAAGFRGFLMGEAFMREPDPGQALHDFLSRLSHDSLTSR